MIERAILTGIIALGIIAAVSGLDVWQLYEIRIMPSECSGHQVETC